MAITKLQPFNLNTTANYTFANVTATNANLGNAATANFFIGSGNNLSNIQGANVTGAVSSATTAATVTTAAQPNITSTGTLSSLSVSGTSNLGAVGNVTITGGSSGQVLSTNGSGGLSFISVSSSGISNGNSNVNIATANGNVTITAVGNTTMTVTGTGANISGTLSVSGNASFANLTSNGTGGNITGANVISANTVSVSGNATIGNIISSGSGGNVTGANVISANTFSASGNITANFYIGNGSQLTGLSTAGVSNGNSNVNIATANGNVTIAAVGNTVLTVTGTGANISGTLSVSGNAAFANLTSNGTGGNITGANVISANTISVSGNATIGNIVSSGSGGNITGANVISANLFTGTLTTAAQPNITSVGTLASLSVTGNITGGNLIGPHNGTVGATTATTGDFTTITSTTTAASGLSLNTSTAGKAHILLKSAGTQKAIIGLVGAILGTNSTDVGIIADSVGGAIKFYANAVSTNSGTFNQYGLGIGAAVPSSGQGITFPATQDASSDANTLDDYEEGTWTPSVGGTATYSSRTGTYTKIGRQVTVWFDVTIGTIGTGSGALTGLPFTNTSSVPGVGAVGYFATLVSSFVIVNPIVPGSGTSITFETATAAATTTGDNQNIWTNSSRCTGFVTYHV